MPSLDTCFIHVKREIKFVKIFAMLIIFSACPIKNFISFSYAPSFPWCLLLLCAHPLTVAARNLKSTFFA